jgi:hypothetical protein
LQPARATALPEPYDATGERGSEGTAVTTMGTATRTILCAAQLIRPRPAILARAHRPATLAPTGTDRAENTP